MIAHTSHSPRLSILPILIGAAILISGITASAAQSPIEALTPTSKAPAYTAAQQQVFNAVDEATRAACEQQLLKLLASQEDRELRAFALRQLQICGDQATVAAVAPFLSHEGLSGQAARTLSAIANRTQLAVQRPAGVALQTCPQLCITPILTLLIERKSADSATIDKILELAAAPSPNTQLALTAISSIGPKKGSPVLLYALKSASGWQRHKLIQENLHYAAILGQTDKNAGLAHLTETEKTLKADDHGAQLHALKVRIETTKQVTDTQLSILESDNRKIRFGAANVIAASVDASLTKRLINRFETTPTARVGILACLIQRDLLAATPPIMSALASDNPELRKLALRASAKLPPAKIVSPLLALLKSDTEADRESAATLLTSLTAAEVNTGLHKLLAHPAPADSHSLALEILADRRDQSSTPLFVANLKNNDKGIRRIAFRRLRDVASATDAKRLLDQFSDDLSATEKRNLQKAVAASIRQEPNISFPPMSAKLKIASEAELEALIPALGIAGTEASVAELKMFASHKSASVRKASVKALSLATTFTAATPLLAIMQHDTDTTIKTLAARGIADLAAASAASPTQRRKIVASALKVAPATERARLQRVHDAIIIPKNVLLGATWNSTLKTVGSVPIDAMTDGNLESNSAWTGNGSYHAILTATMKQAAKVDTIHLSFPISADDDYLYTLLVSPDGRSFKPVSDVTTPGTSRSPGGVVHRIPAQTIKAVRVLHLKNLADGNERVRVIEIRAFPPEETPQIRDAIELSSTK